MTSKVLYAYKPGANFFDPNSWSPAGVPQSGDSATISFGSLTVSGTLPAGIVLGVGGYIRLPQTSRVTLQDATIPNGTTVRSITMFDTYGGNLPSNLGFAGRVRNDGTIILSGGVQTVALGTGTTLANEGTIIVDGAAPTVTAADASATFSNDGLIRIVNTADIAQQRITFGLAVGGTGTVAVSRFATVEFGASAAAQSISFIGGPSAASTVQLDQPLAFGGTIGGFVAGDSLVLANTSVGSTTYTSTGAGSGTLRIFDPAANPVASLTFSGTYTINDFTVAASGSSLRITTDITDPATGSTAVPATGVFRFFSTVDGTHLLTASVTERDRVLIDRPDLVQETNDFGALQATDGSTETVYRFFDTVHGTHFLTASMSERNAVAATRPDLVFEPSASFLEHATQQPGDVPVYRFFSSTDGTHLYTASSAELAALTSPASPAYRPDLRPEGIGFYAPSGSYT